MKQIKIAGRSLFLFIFSISTLCFFSACNKSDNDNNSQTDFKNLRLKTVTGVDGSATQGYLGQLTYDPSGRVTKEEENGKITEYIYSTGKITRKIIQGSQLDVFENELNAEGYIKSSKKIGEPVIYSYEYIAGGFVARAYDNQIPQFEARYYYNQTHTDLLDSIRSTIGGVWNSTSTFIYDMGHHNSLQNLNLGLSASGNIHPRPIKKNTYKYNDGGLVKTQVTDYSYTYDTDGKIIRRSFLNAGQNFDYTYTYY